ncbi:4Fe-4S dicluster-binding protein [Salinispora tropica]|uniref:4Fe-4S ferredoxin, iron-sulfur binding domain protein n=1 Tax=Salinispora tropica (strain ATCC BAA-916 / DSM 44818 / JCM 13857 / NBRC 105044 / CNB-440) TaxID=369723 RepID=A4X703_SALTO|nr:4Fe-4S dicluster-binding protein [Salinispora tropica]ABP54653.1 4Fe-4S ferredoxin, iron-sulfur binding domain protein [Salinispora tropica CNB-440]
MPWTREAAAQAGAARDARIMQRTRNEAWKKPPRRIEKSECITCDTCLRNCPPEFGAIFDRGLDVVIIPELCSGCPVCVLVCPVDCIYPDPQWTPTDDKLWDHIGLTTEDGHDTASRAG